MSCFRTILYVNKLTQHDFLWNVAAYILGFGLLGKKPRKSRTSCTYVLPYLNPACLYWANVGQQNPLCWANVGSLRWANVILLICPTMAQFVGSTMAQRKQYMTHANNQQWTNVGVAIKSFG